MPIVVLTAIAKLLAYFKKSQTAISVLIGRLLQFVNVFLLWALIVYEIWKVNITLTEEH